MAYEDILFEKLDGVATITINRPEVMNAVRTKTFIELKDAFEESTNDGEIGVIVLTGAGDRAFSSGGDVRVQAERTPEVGRAHLRHVMALGNVMRSCGKPIIARVNGYAIGGGHELHLMCDLSIASENAIFGQVGPRVGSIPIWGATQMLPRIVGEKKAREIIFLCHRYSAQEALEMGLVNKVVPPDQLDAAVKQWCEEILDKSQQSLRIAKISLNFESDMLQSSYLHGAEMLCLTYGNKENMEGVHAFLEKREPNYRKFRAPNSSGGSSRAE